MNYVNAAAAVEPGGSVKTHRAGGLGVGYVWGDGDGVLGGGGGVRPCGWLYLRWMCGYGNAQGREGGSRWVGRARGGAGLKLNADDE